MNKKITNNQNGYVLGWAVIMLVVVSLMALLMLSIASRYSKRRLGKNSDMQAYLTSRSAASAVAKIISEAVSTVELDSPAVSYSPDVIPDNGKISVKEFSFDENFSYQMGEIKDLYIERISDEFLRVKALADSNGKESGVSVYLKHGSFPVGINYPELYGFSGIYAGNSLNISSGAYVNTYEGTYGKTDVSAANIVISGGAKNRLLVSGALNYDSLTGTSNGITYDTVGSFSGRKMRTAFDVSASFISLYDTYNNGGTPEELSQIDLDTLKLEKDASGNRMYYMLYPHNLLLNGVNITDAGDSDDTISSKTEINVSDGNNYYIFVSCGSSLNLNLKNSSGGENAGVFVFLDGINGGFNSVGMFDTDLWSGYSSSEAARLNIYNVDSGINLFVYGAEGSKININKQVSITGSIFGDTINCLKTLSLTYSPPQKASSGLIAEDTAKTMHYWDIYSYSMD